jgi:hypothetical protein
MGRDDLYGEMPRNGLDDATADRLLAGALAPEDAPPGYALVAKVVGAAQNRSGSWPLAGRDRAVSAIAAAIASVPGTSSDPIPTRGRRMISKMLTLKALGVALPVMALTAGGAAAATGSLPAHAQSVVSGALSNVGVHVPNGHQVAAAPPPTQAVGPDASGPARHGLCTAAHANGGHPSPRSVAFRNLQEAAATAHDTVTQFCAGVIHPPHHTNMENGTSGSGSPSGTTPTGPPTSKPGVRGGNPHGSSPAEPSSPKPGVRRGNPHGSTPVDKR